MKHPSEPSGLFVPATDSVEHARAISRLQLAMRADDVMEDIRRRRCELSKGDSQLDTVLLRIQQATARRLADIQASVGNNQEVIRVVEGSEQVPAEVVDSPAERGEVAALAAPSAAEAYRATLTELREFREHLAEIDRAVEAMFDVVERQFKRMVERFYADSMPPSAKDRAHP